MHAETRMHLHVKCPLCLILTSTGISGQIEIKLTVSDMKISASVRQLWYGDRHI